MTCAICITGPAPFARTEIDGRYYWACDKCRTETPCPQTRRKIFSRRPPEQLPTRKGVTNEIQRIVLDELSRLHTAEGRAPTLVELADHMRINVRTIRHHLGALRRLGHVAWAESRAKGIEVVA